MSQLNIAETLTSLDPSRDNRSVGLDEDPFERFRALLSDLNILYLHSLLPRSLATGLPPIAHVWAHYAKMTDDNFKEAIQRRPKLFRKFAASIESTPGPALHFIHILLPHYPWEFLPSGKSYYTKDGRGTQKKFRFKSANCTCMSACALIWRRWRATSGDGRLS